MDQEEFKSVMSDYLDVDDMNRLFSDNIEPAIFRAPLNNYFGDDFLTLLSRNTDQLPDQLASLRKNLHVVGDAEQPRADRATAALALGRYVRFRNVKRGRLSNLSASKQWFTLATELDSILGAWELANDHLSERDLVVKVDREHGAVPRLAYKDISSDSHPAPCKWATEAWALGIRLALRQEKAEFRKLPMETLEAGLSCIVNWLTLWSERERYARQQAIASRRHSLAWIDPFWSKLIQKIGRRSTPELKQQLLDQQLAIHLFLTNDSSLTASTEGKFTPSVPQSSNRTDSDHIVIIPGNIPPASDRGDNALLDRYKELQQPVAFARLANLEQLHALRKTLESEFPWAVEAIRVVTGALIARSRYGSIRLGMPPVLLAGEPGTGKTRFAQRLSELLGAPNSVINMAGMRDVNLLKGVSRGWASNRPSRIVEFIQQTNTANPLFILDEVDKAQVGYSGNGGNPYDALLDLLEPGNARRYTDTYLMAECDLSHCLYVLTCNSLRSLPEPLLSRVRMVFFPTPREEHADIITQGICRDMERDWGIPPGTLTLSAAEKARLVGLKPREMKWALIDLFARYGDTTIATMH